MEIAGRAVIVTGGASGLGAATAQALVEAGARALILDANEEAARAKAAELGEGAAFIRADVTKAEDAAAAVAFAKERFGEVSGLVNCAGVAPSERILGKSGPHALESFTRAISINLIGSFNMLRLAAEAMAQNAPNETGERGVIVNTASIAAYDGQIGQAAYAASKGGIVGLTLPAARELARVGIRVVAIAPGIFETPMLAGLPPAAQEALNGTVPFPARLGRPAEYAALALHIFANPYLNGETIRLDGALRMAPR